MQAALSDNPCMVPFVLFLGIKLLVSLINYHSLHIYVNLDNGLCFEDNHRLNFHLGRRVEVV